MIHNSANFIYPISLNDKELFLIDVNQKKTFSIDPWSVTFLLVDKKTIVVRLVGDDDSLSISFINNTDAKIALPKLQNAIDELKNITKTGLDQDTINYINNLILNNNSTYHHIQSTPSNIWSFTHNLNKRTSVSIQDDNSNLVIGLINYIDDNNVTIHFNSPISGDAWI